MRSIALVVPVFLLLLAGSSAGCSRTASDDLRRIRMRGEVVGFEEQRGRLVVAHDDIPGFMNAMTMAFRLKDSSLLHTFVVGDSITATLVISHDATYLDSLRVTWHPAARDSAGRP